MSSVSETVLTYEDILHYMTSLLDGGARTKDLRMHKEVIQGSYRDISMGNEWQYYMDEGRIDMTTGYKESTVTYNATSKALTLTDGSKSWPTWAKYGRLKIGDDIYNVKSRDSNTVLTLGDLAPTGNLSATSYELVRSIYQLPDDLWRLYDVAVMESNWITYYITPTEWQQRESYLSGSGQPWAWTIMKDPHEMNRWSLWVDPSPDTSEPLMFVYRRKPRTLRWAGTETKARTYTASGSSGNTTLTTSTALPSSMVGSVIRLTSDGTLATGLSGNNPYTEQHEIIGLSGTTVTLSGALDDNHSPSKIIISDPIDMSDTMLEAFKAQIEYRMARFSNDQRGTVQARKVADLELRRALESESRIGSAMGSRYSRYDYLFTHLDGHITTSSQYGKNI